jgi:mannitol/fructose-specific phosphotransferase system IIA component (Ntr-type)
MNVAAHLRPELIRVAPPWTSFDETVSGLVQVLVDGGALPAESAADAANAVSEREALASTALLDIHAAVPHARLSTLRTTAVCLAVAGRGLYEAVPTVAIHIVALVLSPATANTDHLNVLASMATLLRSPELRAALLAARDGREAFGLLVERA